jgi:hypothetical protein
MTAKNLFKGMVRFNRELFIEYAQAYTDAQAKLLIAKRIARKQEVLPVTVLTWMKDHPESYEIIKEMEFTEDI